MILAERIRGGGADKRDSNTGVSLGQTVTTGGHYGAKRSGVSGSTNMNTNIKRNRSHYTRKGYGKGIGNPKQRLPTRRMKLNLPTHATALVLGRATTEQELQELVIDVVTGVILAAFGNTAWFRACMNKLASIPKQRLLPGGLIPASHIWWTANPKVHHVHTDTNTIPPAFVFCPETFSGGALICRLPCGPCRVELKAGTIVGGSWAQFPHCNSAVRSGSFRRSFVVYLDNRIVSSSYVTIDK